MSTVYMYETLHSSLKLPPKYINGEYIIALHETGARVSIEGYYAYAWYSARNHKNVVWVEGDTKNWGNHMERLFQDLARLAISGKLVVVQTSEENCFREPPKRFTIIPQKAITEYGEIIWNIEKEEYYEHSGLAR